jgi:ABC-type nitrate/sulfonate/bicarbonate transport system substrate-binding protein
VDKVAFPYRSSSHLPLLHVISESGSWERHGLEVAYDRGISAGDAHKQIPTGEVEFVGGNHVSTYAHRARGDSWVYLGQTVNYVHSKLCVRADSGINGIDDLYEKKVGTRGSHPGLNDWLYLKQRGLDTDRDEVELINQLKHKKGDMDPVKGKDGEANEPLYDWVKNKKVDAAFLTQPAAAFAAKAGLKLIDIEPLPMIWFTTVSTSLKFAEKHPDLVERFLKGIIEGIHFFKTEREKSIKIIQTKYTKEGKLNKEFATLTYESIADNLEPKLVPSMQSIANVYQEALRQDKDAKKVNPLELWDTHFIRKIDDSGFVRNLYGNKKH